MKKTPHALESITVRRAKLVDADKVRYRVYSTPKEFIAVIAESALMAVKVSGVSKPHKIVRDLPTEGVAIEAQKIAKADEAAERIQIPVKKQTTGERLKTEIAKTEPAIRQGAFKAMNLGDMKQKSAVNARVIPPEMISQIIEDHLRAAGAQAATPVTSAPMEESSAPMKVEAAQEPEPELSSQEKIRQLASELLPEKLEQGETTLSPEEVEKLLNG